jgi:hypothetical protein
LATISVALGRREQIRILHVLRWHHIAKDEAVALDDFGFI